MFSYDEKAVYVTFSTNEAKQSVKSYLALVIDDLVFDDIATFHNNILTIPHKNIYSLSEENLLLLGFPGFFDSDIEIELEGLVNQNNARFIVNIFSKHKTLHL